MLPGMGIELDVLVCKDNYKVLQVIVFFVSCDSSQTVKTLIQVQFLFIA